MTPALHASDALSFESPNLRVTMAGNDGIIVSLPDGRDDVWPAAHILLSDAQRLRDWLCQQIESNRENHVASFSEELDMACSEQGTGRKLALHLGVSDMCVSHWRKGHALPRPSQAILIAGFFGWSRNAALEMLSAECAQKATERKMHEDAA